ncbi:Cu(I)-responsive transcriptional regulator [Aestuariicella hydrocarbonica]|uniref:Cu(I)-responsive transcriptional regulator n=1 Tax=Pseudomaricurvus hydrocarbonicus TaxID=1470433 RepID=A0A9E5JTE7_9GAMM|nr:Cu(I)-responsive transcriptional regulator [Aestuariicella hydrocarbonica]NHO64510.1 Cu(I)-responsive transcriptional regulator [Aestuariicella hydrocarbonica]
MNISQAAKASGLSPKTIRYYERIELIGPASRGENGYRDYNTKDLDVLRFVQRARATGFSVEECRQLLSLYQNPERHSSEVKSLVQGKLKRVEAQIVELNHMRDTLQDLVQRCPGNEVAQCAIIDNLADQETC